MGASEPARQHTEGRAETGAEELPVCQTCGRPLGLDAEDEPTGDAGGPICGECNRARNFDVLFER